MGAPQNKEGRRYNNKSTTQIVGLGDFVVPIKRNNGREFLQHFFVESLRDPFALKRIGTAASAIGDRAK